MDKRGKMSNQKTNDYAEKLVSLSKDVIELFMLSHAVRWYLMAENVSASAQQVAAFYNVIAPIQQLIINASTLHASEEKAVQGFKNLLTIDGMRKLTKESYINASSNLYFQLVYQRDSILPGLEIGVSKYPHAKCAFEKLKDHVLKLCNSLKIDLDKMINELGNDQ